MLLATTLLSLIPLTSRASEPPPPASEAAPPPVAYHPNGDLFPKPWRPSISAATGLPFFGIAELGMGITNGFAIGVVGGLTPSVPTAGVRPRFRVRATEHVAVVLNMPMLWYPKSRAVGPGNLGESSWVLTRPELLLDATVTDRLHLAGGMGIIAAASVEAIDDKLQGKELAVPGYNGASETKKGFAGGIWNTVAFRTSFALGPATHLFAEGSLVMRGVVPADNVGAVPIVANVGVQHTF